MQQEQSVNTTLNVALVSRPMLAVLAAQFLSALADNALLFAAIALLRSQTHYEDWHAPLLQDFFVLAFIVFAPFVGPFADSISKGRVMMASNGLKFFGAAAMLAGLNPWLAYGLVGLGAAAYSPAKYGILRQLVSAEKLIKANSLMEGSTIVAILLGVVLGGWLADISVRTALLSVAACYLLAALSNLLIPRLPPEHPLRQINTVELVRDFGRALSTLFRNSDARFSLIGTSLFWGSGATLRFLLVAWVPVALLISDNKTPANLSGVVAVGIALGALLAARLITLSSVSRALYPGLLLGIAVMALAQIHDMTLAIALLVLVGACGGMFVVPMNALLQERGHETVGAGHAVAVQNFCDNLAMLLLVGFYTLIIRTSISIPYIALGFGALILLGMLGLVWLRRRTASSAAA